MIEHLGMDATNDFIDIGHSDNARGIMEHLLLGRVGSIIGNEDVIQKEGFLKKYAIFTDILLIDYRNIHAIVGGIVVILVSLAIPVFLL